MADLFPADQFPHDAFPKDLVEAFEKKIETLNDAKIDNIIASSRIMGVELLVMALYLKNMERTVEYYNVEKLKETLIPLTEELYDYFFAQATLETLADSVSQESSEIGQHLNTLMKLSVSTGVKAGIAAVVSLKALKNIDIDDPNYTDMVLSVASGFMEEI